MAEDVVSKKKSPMMMIIVMIVIGLVLAGGVSYFIATKVMADSVGNVASRDPGVFVKLGDPKEGIIVNVGGVKSGRFLKIGLALEMNPKKGVDEKGAMLAGIETRVLDTVLQVLREQKLEDFDPAKQEDLKILIRDELNKLIGENAVYEVYITNFVLQ